MAVTPSGKDKLLRYARLFVGGYDLPAKPRKLGQKNVTPEDEADEEIAALTRT